MNVSELPLEHYSYLQPQNCPLPEDLLTTIFLHFFPNHPKLIELKLVCKCFKKSICIIYKNWPYYKRTLLIDRLYLANIESPLLEKYKTNANLEYQSTQEFLHDWICIKSQNKNLVSIIRDCTGLKFYTNSSLEFVKSLVKIHEYEIAFIYATIKDSKIFLDHHHRLIQSYLIKKIGYVKTIQLTTELTSNQYREDAYISVIKESSKNLTFRDKINFSFHPFFLSLENFTPFSQKITEVFINKIIVWYKFPENCDVGKYTDKTFIKLLNMIPQNHPFDHTSELCHVYMPKEDDLTKMNVIERITFIENIRRIPHKGIQRQVMEMILENFYDSVDQIKPYWDFIYNLEFFFNLQTSEGYTDRATEKLIIELLCKNCIEFTNTVTHPENHLKKFPHALINLLKKNPSWFEKIEFNDQEDNLMITNCIYHLLQSQNIIF